MYALAASLPLAIVIVAMTVLRWRAVSAGLAGLAAALLLAVTLFDLGRDAGIAPTLAAGGAFAEALFVTATILWIIFPALCIYEMQARSGAFDTIRAGLSRLSTDPRMLVLLVAWFFALFMEGVAGFGTPVALAAPILIGLGFPPVKAVTLALIGHAAGVSFGAVGTPVIPQIAATGLSGIDLARPVALLHALLGWMLVAFLFVLSSGDARTRGWQWPALATCCFFVPFLLLAWFVGPELPTLGGAIVGGALFALVLRRAGPGPEVAGPPARAMLQAALPYLVLLALILATRLAPPLREVLRSVTIEWSLFGSFGGRMEVLYHPGTMLFLGFAIGGLMQGRRHADLLSAMRGAGARLLPVAAALVAMLGLSRVMVHAGMIGGLAETAAASGAAWPFLAPFVGVLGTFVTGSATASNVLFSEFQQATAVTLSLPVATLQGAQNFGAAVGNIVSPHNIIAGAATVGLAAGREGEVLRATVLVCLLYVTAGGIVTALLSAT